MVRRPAAVPIIREHSFFRVTTTGKEHVLYSFKGPPDGSAPMTELTAIGGDFYGTTSGGGKYITGTVFELSASGSERVLYAFGSRPNDGQFPTSPLTVVKGSFYGVTGAGGSGQSGIVFAVMPSGKARTLHNFGRGTDGELPNGRLIVSGNTLLGTTQYGGINRYGTVFALDLLLVRCLRIFLRTRAGTIRRERRCIYRGERSRRLGVVERILQVVGGCIGRAEISGAERFFRKMQNAAELVLHVRNVTGLHDVR